MIQLKKLREVQKMPNSAETIERLTRELEQQKFYLELRECKTMEDFQALTEKYKTICESQTA